MLRLKNALDQIVDSEICNPLSWDNTSNLCGSRLGGNPPVGITPKVVNEYTRYFATLAFGEVEMSIFSSFEEDGSTAAYNSGKMFSLDCPFIQVVFHAPAERALSSLLESNLRPPLAIKIGDSVSDYVTDPISKVVYRREGPKLGGYPVFYQSHRTYAQDAIKLIENGWVHLMQFEYIRSNAPIKGNWPFLGNVFHIFVKYLGQQNNDINATVDLKYIWG